MRWHESPKYRYQHQWEDALRRMTKPNNHLSPESQDWLDRQLEQAEIPSNNPRCYMREGALIICTITAVMTDYTEAHIAASLNPRIGDWACYLGAGSVWYAIDYGRKLEEKIARACYPEVPADFRYRP